MKYFTAPASTESKNTRLCFLVFHFTQEDESKWTQRPLPEHLVSGAVLNVCFLRPLRMKLMEDLLSIVTQGTDLYLNEISQISEELLPAKFVSLSLS